MVGPRAAELYAGLLPDALYARELTRAQGDYYWQWTTYFEAALLDEVNGNTDRARHRMGQAKLIAALEDPMHSYQKELADGIARLGAVTTVL